MDQNLTSAPDRAFLRNDKDFDLLYPLPVRKFSEMHWTPLDVIAEACEFLASPGARVLDAGSGAGKFCIAGGLLYPEAVFFGIEQREHLSLIAEQVRARTGAYNVRLLHGNITSLDAADYDHFYFYNSFCEQIQPWSRIDCSVPVSAALHRQYQAHFHDMLMEKPAGTKLVTYHTPNAEVPRGYRLVRNTYKKYLKCWIKEA